MNTTRVVGSYDGELKSGVVPLQTVQELEAVDDQLIFYDY
jgi:hypothetical protein